MYACVHLCAGVCSSEKMCVWVYDYVSRCTDNSGRRCENKGVDA